MEQCKVNSKYPLADEEIFLSKLFSPTRIVPKMQRFMFLTRKPTCLVLDYLSKTVLILGKIGETDLAEGNLFTEICGI